MCTVHFPHMCEMQVSAKISWKYYNYNTLFMEKLLGAFVHYCIQKQPLNSLTWDYRWTTTINKCDISKLTYLLKYMTMLSVNVNDLYLHVLNRQI